ncbi:GGDEF domain-containing protein [Pseudoroseicyclus sp. CXY001]|uniref:GGDEF domain-containing protein n=1 Tax=Pseudoroseicyclus sp. CXY001 TaxID=3242492 RepID=UPI003570B243
MTAFLTIIHSVGLMALATMLYGTVQRKALSRPVRHVIIGGVFGAAAVVMMLEPIPVAEGIFVDLRNLVIGFAAAFTGPIGAAVALVIISCVRFLIGGLGAPYGVIALILSALLGLAWARPSHRDWAEKPRNSILFGVMMTLPVLTILLIPGAPLQRSLAVTATLLGAHIVGTLTFGLFIQRERQIARRERTLADTANHDPLTGCLNRRGFERRLEVMSEAAGAQGAGKAMPAGIAMLLIDLDRFKTINDTRGHAVGDEVLVQVAAVLLSEVRPGDCVARLGGEEFAVILRNVTERDSRRIAERLRRSIEELAIVDGGERVAVTASIGGGHFTRTVPDLAAALPMIDKRLYAAKAAGRNCTVMSEAA